MLKNAFKSLDLRAKALSGSWQKNSAIANNIANVNTPGYKKQTVNFQKVLENEMQMNQMVTMKKTNSKHIDSPYVGDFQVETVNDTSYRVDDNNVDIDVENAEMAKNTLYYNTIINSVNSHSNRIKTALRINK